MIIQPVIVYLLNDNYIGFQDNPIFVNNSPLKVILDLPDVAHIYFKLFGRETVVVNLTYLREVFYITLQCENSPSYFH
jgi:hypothetical protein